MITRKGLGERKKEVRTLEEEFQAEWDKLKPTNFFNNPPLRYEVAKKFFKLGRESTRVLIEQEDGRIEVFASEGVKIAILDLDDEDRFYNHTDSQADTENALCEDDDCACDPMTREERMTKIPEDFKGLKEIEGDQF